MKKKNYKRPAMLVTELISRPMMVPVSGQSAGKSASMSVTYTEEDWDN